MAVRKTLSHDDKTRERIKTSQIINRLQSFAFGEIDLERDRIKAIEILLKKTLPDLATVTVAGDPNKPLNAELTVTFRRTDG